MKSFKSFIIEKLKVTNNNLNGSIEDADLVHIADMLSDYIGELAYQNDEDIENTIDELRNNTVCDCLSYWDNAIEEFIDFFNDNSAKKYDETELANILSTHDNELTEMVLKRLNR